MYCYMAGKQLGIPVTCVMPVIAPFTKVDRCRKFGANVILKGEEQCCLFFSYSSTCVA